MKQGSPHSFNRMAGEGKFNGGGNGGKANVTLNPIGTKFIERFKGKISVMDKEGHIGIVASSNKPIQKMAPSQQGLRALDTKRKYTLQSSKTPNIKELNSYSSNRNIVIKGDVEYTRGKQNNISNNKEEKEGVSNMPLRDIARTGGSGITSSTSLILGLPSPQSTRKQLGAITNREIASYTSRRAVNEPVPPTSNSQILGQVPFLTRGDLPPQLDPKELSFRRPPRVSLPVGGGTPDYEMGGVRGGNQGVFLKLRHSHVGETREVSPLEFLGHRGQEILRVQHSGNNNHVSNVVEGGRRAGSGGRGSKYTQQKLFQLLGGEVLGGRNSAGRIHNNGHNNGYDIGWNPEPEQRFGFLPPMQRGGGQGYNNTKSNSRASKGVAEGSGSDSDGGSGSGLGIPGVPGIPYRQSNIQGLAPMAQGHLSNRVHYYGPIQRVNQGLPHPHPHPHPHITNNKKERYLIRQPKIPIKSAILSTYNHQNTHFMDRSNRPAITKDLLGKYKDLGDKVSHNIASNIPPNITPNITPNLSNRGYQNTQEDVLYTNKVLVPIVGSAGQVTHLGKMLVNPLGIQTIDPLLIGEDNQGGGPKHRTKSTRVGYKKRKLLNIEYMRKSPSLSLIDRKLITSDIT